MSVHNSLGDISFLHIPETENDNKSGNKWNGKNGGGGEKKPKGEGVPRRERQPVSSTTHQAYNHKVQPQGQAETSSQTYQTYHK